MPQAHALDTLTNGLPPGDLGDGPAPPPPGRKDDADLPLNPGDRDLNPPGIGLLALFREDLRTHDNDFMEPGFWAVALHRFGNWRMGIRFKLLRSPMTLLYRSWRGPPS